MRFRNVLIVLVTLCLIGGALSFTGTGSSSSGHGTTACNDGSDNDGDGLVDGNDPGCTKPYYKDGSESFVYDLDASWVFEDTDGSGTVTGSEAEAGTSIYFGSYVVNETNIKPDSGTSTFSEKIVEGPADPDNGWGGGTVSETTIDISDWDSNSRTVNGHNTREATNPPGDSTTDRCGNGQENTGDELSCPQDHGVPGNTGVDQTASSTNTVTDNLPSYEAPASLRGKSAPSVTVDYNPDLVVKEKESQGDINIRSKSSDDSIILEHTSSSGAPDFFLTGFGYTDEDKIKAVYPKSSVKQAATVTHYYLNNENVDDYSSSGTVYTNCKDTDSSTPDQCPSSYDGTSGCFGTKSASVTDDKLEDDSKTITIDTEKITVSGSGGSASSSTSNLGVTFDVLHKDHDVPASSTVNYDKCSDDGNNYYSGSCGSGCKFTGSETLYTSTNQNYDDAQSVTYTVKWEDVSLAQEEIFSVDPSDTVSQSGSFSGGKPSTKEALFDGDYTNLDNVLESREGFTWDVDTGSSSAKNDPANTYSEFDLDVSGGDIISHRTVEKTVDADGPNGRSDSYVAIRKDSSTGSWEIVGAGSDFASQETVDGGLTDWISPGDVSPQACPDFNGKSYIKCVGYVDFFTKKSGWDHNDYGNNAMDYQYKTGNPHVLDESLGVSKLYNYLRSQPEQGSSNDGTYDGVKAPANQSCGAEPGEKWIYKEGPEVDHEHVDESVIDYQECTKMDDACVLNGEAVEEGTVANIASENESYEKGGPSPDREVCLQLEGTGIGQEGDYLAGDNENNDATAKDYGAEWYDLDSEAGNEYLQGSGSSLVGPNPGDKNYITYYWNGSVNPPLDTRYNPEGGRSGTALEDDCGNPRTNLVNGRTYDIDCNDAGTAEDGEPTFFNFFIEGMRDEDYHPEGKDQGSGYRSFDGVMNKMQDDSNQLEPGMDTTTFGMSSTSDSNGQSKWNDSESGGRADEWAVSMYTNWSVSNTGTPYPPFSTYYKPGTPQRGVITSPSVSKTGKIFGNSYAAVVNETYLRNNGISSISVENGAAHGGDGVWIDPDMIGPGQDRYNLSESGNWKDALKFNIDITGPDAGLGYHSDTISENLVSGPYGGHKVVIKDIYWEKDSSGSMVGSLERPVCGDDQREFLIEEVGESENSGRFDGRYACSDSLNSCYDGDTNPSERRIVERGESGDVEEPGEEVGRLKKDQEYCMKMSHDDFALWYDQDYSKEVCNYNTLYGDNGIRWINQDYIQQHPFAVYEGIDDDWNKYLKDRPSVSPNESVHPSNYIAGTGETPVSTGVEGGSLSEYDQSHAATVGFCGGEDSSEYLVTQECQSSLCETDRSVIGVGKTSGRCVLDASGMDLENDTRERRQLYATGEKVQVELSGDTQTLGCYNSVWYDKWPIVFSRDNLEVGKGDTSLTSFQVINVASNTREFKVSIQDTDVARFTEFSDFDGDSFTTRIGPESSKQFQIEIYGGDTSIDSSPVRLQAETVNADVSGTDSMTVDIVNQTGTEPARNSATRNVPGIGPLHLVVLTLLSTLFYMRQS